MGTKYPHAFAPFTLGPLTLRNRLVALPAGTALVHHGVPTHGDVEHFERLAQGGIGMIVGGATVVHPTTTLRSRILVEAYIDEVVPALREKADAVHRHGAKLIGQLVHLGREFIGGESDSPPVAPSALKTPRDAYPPHELTEREIADVIDGWRLSTEHLANAGLDGVEIHAAHGYLVAQFMSPQTNLRTDGYGGSFEKRMRFLDETIAAMRTVMPRGFVLGVRLSGEEEIPGGMTIDDCVRIAEHLTEVGVDYLSITHGTRGLYVKDNSNPDAVAVKSAERVKIATGLPVLVGQRIRDVAMADHIVAVGQADLVGMARALIADPELPVKSLEGREREVRSCLGFNQDCRAFDPNLFCAVNAEIGRGRHPNYGVKVATPQSIYIIGGGPAGMEAARVAALRGHKVSLFERAHDLGGSVRVAAAGPTRATLVDIVDYLELETRRLGVDINLGAAVEAGDLEEILTLADHVIVATGSKPAPPPDAVAAAPVQVVTVDDVLTDGIPPTGGRALVYDTGDGFWPAYSAAEKLAAKGWSVTFATPLAALAARIPGESVPRLLRRLGEADVDLRVAHTLVLPDRQDGPCLLRPAFGGHDLEVSADLVVWHQPRLANSTLGFGPLDDPRVSIIGDCLAPRRIGHAIAEAYRIGVEV